MYVQVWVEGEGSGGVPVGAMDPTARPIAEAVKDSKHVIPRNRTNLHPHPCQT